jgi:hypothetical protein
MPGVHKALHLTAIPLRSIAAGELYRMLLKFNAIVKIFVTFDFSTCYTK